MSGEATMAATPRAKSSARLHAVQGVYQILMTGNTAADVIDDFMVYRIGYEPEMQGIERPAVELFSNIVQGVERQRDEITGVIGNHLKEGRNVADMNEKEPLLFAVLLCGTYELMAHLDIDAPLIISDYIDITHSYYEGQESRIVNGILDAIRPLYRGKER